MSSKRAPLRARPRRRGRGASGPAVRNRAGPGAVRRRGRGGEGARGGRGRGRAVAPGWAWSRPSTSLIRASPAPRPPGLEALGPSPLRGRERGVTPAATGALLVLRRAPTTPASRRPFSEPDPARTALRRGEGLGPTGGWPRTPGPVAAEPGQVLRPSPSERRGGRGAGAEVPLGAESRWTPTGAPLPRWGGV